MQENLSSGFPTKWDSNQPAQLQRLAPKLNFTRRKSRYDTFQLGNNKGPDQTAQMLGLVWAFVVGKPPKTVFSRQGLYDKYHNLRSLPIYSFTFLLPGEQW